MKYLTYIFIVGLMLLVVACGVSTESVASTEEVSVVKEVAEIVNTATPLPPTATATPLPPTATSVPTSIPTVMPTSTSVPPTAIATAEPTATPIPPTATPIPEPTISPTPIPDEVEVEKVTEYTEVKEVEKLVKVEDEPQAINGVEEDSELSECRRIYREADKVVPQCEKFDLKMLESDDDDYNSNLNISYDSEGLQQTILGRIYCEGTGSVVFKNSIYPPNEIDKIYPMGSLAPGRGHATPVDHSYWYRKQPSSKISVLIPADGYLVSVERFDNERNYKWNPSIKIPDYRVMIAHTCTFFTHYIHLGEISDQISSIIGRELERGESWEARKELSGDDAINQVKLKAGTALSDFGDYSIDFSVHDAETTLEGFITPSLYEVEPWKIHTVDFFEPFEASIENSLKSKSLRQTEPKGGRIDFDIKDTIQGNWFQIEAKDYASSGISPTPSNYWQYHLAFVYDSINPDSARISIGFETGISHESCNVCFGAYAAKNNAFKPETIGPSSGLVKIELVHLEMNSINLGTLLVEHQGNSLIKVEVFPYKKPYQVDGFTENAKLYER